MEQNPPDGTAPDEAAQDTAPNEAAQDEAAQDTAPNEAPQDKTAPELRGLYRHVKVSVRTLDAVIVAGILAIVLLVLWSASGDGYTVRFDARGGSDVPAQTVLYGEFVAEPDPPERNGYAFGGWYLDEGCGTPWLFPEYRVEGDTTLFARWIPDS